MEYSLLSRAYRIRKVEQFIADQCAAGAIPLPIHLSIGQECVAVALNCVAQPEDYIWPTYRSHAYYIDRHKDLTSFFAELLGKAGGCSGGRGGSMHLHSGSARILGTSGIVGTNAPNAVGFSYAMKRIKQDGIVWAIFGDGATDAGVFYDAINIALLKKTRTIFFIEDNDLAIRTPKNVRQWDTNIAKKTEAFGIKTLRTSGGISQLMVDYQKARNYVVNREMPIVIITPVTRWYQHLGFGYELSAGYRDFSRENIVKQNDEVTCWVNSLKKSDLDNIDNEIQAEIQEAFRAAELDLYPDSSSLMDFVR
jgi:TPP-dependent pyruvate/acetoin dehydrogenase alpha subunit